MQKSLFLLVNGLIKSILLKIDLFSASQIAKFEHFGVFDVHKAGFILSINGVFGSFKVSASVFFKREQNSYFPFS